MDFTYHKLGRLKKNQKVEVTLEGNAANIFLMDEATFKRYQQDKKRQGIGGLMKHSPVYMNVPHSGRWFLTVDFGGYNGKVKCNVKVYPVGVVPAKQVAQAG